MDEICFDGLGPSKVIHLHCPILDFRAFVVVDNTALGVAIGGVRVSPQVGPLEVARLARTMTLKSSMAGLPHGGAKAGIRVDPSRPDMERIFRRFARMIREMREYVPAPDMGCNEDSMVWIKDEIGRVLGLPEEIGGLPLDKLGATGFGLAECAEVACEQAGISLKGARVAIHGYGSVGMAAARFLSAKGAILVAVADIGGTVHCPDGLDLNALLAAKELTSSVTGLAGRTLLGSDEIFGLDCDLLIPAATPDVIHEANVDTIKARIILEGANIPATIGAEKLLAKKGVLVMPDFIANAGGLIMAAMEYAGKTEAQAFEAISEKIKLNSARILERSRALNQLPRQAAEELASERVRKAMRYRPYTYA